MRSPIITPQSGRIITPQSGRIISAQRGSVFKGLLGLVAILVIGLSVLLFGPFPWQITSFRALLTLPEMLLWWSMFPSLVPR